MSYNKARANMQQKMARQAREGMHWAAEHSELAAPEFEVGETAIIKKTGEAKEVLSKASWGDYELRGFEGKWFSPSSLDKAE